MEARTLALLAGAPNVIVLLDGFRLGSSGSNNGVPMLLMSPFLCTLQQYIVKLASTVQEPAQMEPKHYSVSPNVATSLVHALSYLHGLGLSHRAVTPLSVLLTPHDGIKLADFASTMPAAVSARPQPSPQLGSGEYCGKKVDAAALGMTLMQLTCLRLLGSAWGPSTTGGLAEGATSGDGAIGLDWDLLCYRLDL